MDDIYQAIHDFDAHLSSKEFFLPLLCHLFHTSGPAKPATYESTLRGYQTANWLPHSSGCASVC